MKRAVAAILFGLALGAPAQACTAFLLNKGDARVFGRNHDWSVDDGLVLVNKRQMARAGGPGPDAARWISRFGSVSFNQYGRNQPLGGINEAGLVIATLWLDETRHRPPDSVPGLGSLGWVQYQLDCCSTVAEVLASDSKVRIDPGPGSTVHYLVADASGTCATVEFLAGKPVYHSGAALPHPTIANNACAESRLSLAGLEPWGGGKPVPTDFSSLARYARACLYLDRFDPAGPVPARDWAFSMLSSVSSGMATMWSIVYDVPARAVWFRTRRNQALRSIELGRLDFSGATPCLMLEVNAPLSGNATGAFEQYTLVANRQLIGRVFAQVSFLRDVHEEALDAIARAPEFDLYVGE